MENWFNIDDFAATLMKLEDTDAFIRFYTKTGKHVVSVDKSTKQVWARCSEGWLPLNEEQKNVLRVVYKKLKNVC